MLKDYRKLNLSTPQLSRPTFRNVPTKTNIMIETKLYPYLNQNYSHFLQLRTKSINRNSSSVDSF